MIVALFLVVLMGAAAFAIDESDFRAQRRQLQTIADSAALAGAMQLPPLSDGSRVCSQAAYYEHQNSTSTDSKNMVVDSNLDTSYCQVMGSSVRVQPTESRVPFLFGRALGFGNATLSARARARIVYLTRSSGLLPFGVEDLRPSRAWVTVDATGQQIPLATVGCGNDPSSYPYWCSGAYVNSLPAGGSTISMHVVDTGGQQIDWANVGYLGSDQQPLSSGTTATACSGTNPCVKDVVYSPLTNQYLYYSSTETPPVSSFTVQAHLTNVPAGATVTLAYDGTSVTAQLLSGSNANGIWTNPSNKPFALATSESSSGQDVSVTIKTGNGKNAVTLTTKAPAQHSYARDDGDILQQFVADRHYVDPSLAANTSGRYVNFSASFIVLVKGKLMTLKLGGGGAQGNSGNYGGLDLDTNQTWPQYACYANNGTPNTADEVQHGACTPYSIGSSVVTQTGNFAGQINNGLKARIGSSPNQWTGPATPPPPGDPRWMSLILVPPLTFTNCTGTCSTTVIGFGNFYITDYSGWPGSTLKQGEIQGVFWDHPNTINQYSTTCNDPQGICLASVALMPWDG
ncbi:MAG: pilus assembly protein TadG-related protein [Gaiellales bacterium]